MSEIIVSGGTTSVSTVDASDTYLVEGGGTLDILSGGLVSGLITVAQAGTLIVSSGGTALDTMIGFGGTQFDYGSANGTTISYGGSQIVESGGSASGTTINSGGTQYDHGSANGTTVSSGGYQEVSSGIASGTVIIEKRLGEAGAAGPGPISACPSAASVPL
jgi:autotransporter passenger strand-loop-strand repeat protein